MAQLVKEAIHRVESRLEVKNGSFDAITNQLADLLHYCEFHSIDFNDALEQAKDFVIEEQSCDYYNMPDGK
jgi:hypothetical protein